jgi:UDP-glucose 4-epimerase
MQVFRGNNPVCLFGVGLLGQAISRALRQRQAAPPESIAYDWDNRAQRAQTLAQLRQNFSADAGVDLIWAAGRAGFGSSDRDARLETESFEEVLTFASDLARDGHRTTVHLISSAGGLFEGQTHVGAEAEPAPRRPYGQCKLEQERALAAAVARWAGLAARIYRPSTVYGYEPDRRLGLIATLLVNARAGRPTPITGSRETLRDYVLTDDVGRFVASQVARQGDGIQTFLLASGRSHSIQEVIDDVAAVLGACPPLDEHATPSNAADMSFAPNAVPDGWQVTPLRSGIAETLARVDRHRAETGGRVE